MIKLGDINIVDSVSVIESRNKIRLLAEDLSFDVFCAVRIAIAFSELCRNLYRRNGASHVAVGFDRHTEGFGLLLVFQGDLSEDVVTRTSCFFDKIDSLPGGVAGVSAFKYIPKSDFEPTELFISNERERLNRLSKAELLIEVKRKNEELQVLFDELKQRAEKEKILAAAVAVADVERKKSRELSKAYKELEKVREHEHHLANYDTVTGLPNRAFFQDRLQQAIASADRNKQRLAVLFIDLDHFKKVNDTLGHAMGDQLLRMVSERSLACVRKSDTVARLGGDEFTLILLNIGRVEVADTIARNLIRELSQPYLVAGREFFLGASIGIAIYPDDGNEMEVLVRNADTAMYRVKQFGRNHHQFYSSDMSDQTAERLELENDLRKAIKLGELLLYYQPQLDCISGRIVSMEALLRWQHPQRGLVFPDSFIPLAEETGLIVEIGEWVLRAACIQNKKWQDMGYAHMPIAVNLSMRQFEQDCLVEATVEILKETGLSAQWLELELTEGVFLHNVKRASLVLKKLRSLGVVVSIDDFGTGYSSLSQLRRLPIDRIKVDRSFIQGVPKDSDDAAIVAAIIVLARKLNLNVIAEGVETEAQLDFLREQGCDQWQGYLCSKPVPVNEFEKLLDRQRVACRQSCNCDGE